MIIDCHTHIGKGPEGCSLSDVKLLNIMDKTGIDKTVIFPFNENDEVMDYHELNSKILISYKKYPDRLIPFFRINPHFEKCKDEIDWALDNGFIGLKLHPNSEKFREDDIVGLVDYLNNKIKVIIFHTDHKENALPLYFENIYKKYEDINFILGHAGKDSYKEAAGLAQKYKNVYIETSILSLNRTGIAIKLSGAEKVLFGSDNPYGHPLIEKTKYELINLTEEEREKIYSVNFLKILK